jgi:hypothetical protein
MAFSFINDPEHWRNRASPGPDTGHNPAFGARQSATAVVSRIFFLDAVGPQDRPWMWASGRSGHIRRAPHGYDAR